MVTLNLSKYVKNLIYLIGDNKAVSNPSTKNIEINMQQKTNTVSTELLNNKNILFH